MNEYLEAFEALFPSGSSGGFWGGPRDFDEELGAYRARYPMCRKYAWAIPSDAAIATIAALSPIVEIGAGGGYWAKLLREAGADVVAYDVAPYKNHWVEGRWSGVHNGGPQMVGRHPDRTLLLCWPPMSEMAAEALKRYRGDTVAYIGEGAGGCTASDVFHARLERSFDCAETVAIPKWPGLHDYLTIWRRNDG
jgi:hypothetical protein